MAIGIYKRKFKPLLEVGDKYNKLTVVEFHHRDKSHSQFWIFKCECGNEKIIKAINVKKGSSKSCGCSRTKHGITSTKTYKVWSGMKQRCLNPNATRFKDYGGRGIKVCDRWLNSFTNFLVDMGICPKELSLDRENNNLGYCKSNCRWADAKTQANNRRNNL